MFVTSHIQNKKITLDEYCKLYSPKLDTFQKNSGRRVVMQFGSSFEQKLLIQARKKNMGISRKFRKKPVVRFLEALINRETLEIAMKKHLPIDYYKNYTSFMKNQFLKKILEDPAYLPEKKLLYES